MMVVKYWHRLSGEVMGGNIHRNIQGQAERDSELLDLVWDVSSHCKGVELDGLKIPSNQTILWFVSTIWSCRQSVVVLALQSGVTACSHGSVASGDSDSFSHHLWMVCSLFVGGRNPKTRQTSLSTVNFMDLASKGGHTGEGYRVLRPALDCSSKTLAPIAQQFCEKHGRIKCSK